MPSTEPEARRSRVGRMETRADGTTRCRLAIPLGHPAAQRVDQNGEVFEVENDLVYAAGPGNRELRWIEPGAETEHPVGEDLLPTDADSAVRISAGNLSAYLRKAARGFDRHARIRLPQTAPE